MVEAEDKVDETNQLPVEEEEEEEGEEEKEDAKRKSVWQKSAELLDRFFHISERDSTIFKEFRAGTVSFLTLSYLIVVNPIILGDAGINQVDGHAGTVLSSAVACLIVGICGNLPFGMAPGLGLSSYLSYSLVLSGLLSYQEALTAAWLSGLITLLFTILRLGNVLMKIFPLSFKLAIVVGMGLLIATIGLISEGFIVGNPDTLVGLGDVWNDWTLLLAMGGVLLIGTLMYYRVKGSVLFGIIVVTILYWAIANDWPKGVVSVPRNLVEEKFVDFNAIADTSIASAFWPAVFTFLLVILFDVSGVAFGLASMAERVDDEGHFDLFWTLISSAVGTMVAAWTGSTPIIATIECSTGIQDGGRTGLTAVVTAFWFLISIFLAPLLGSIPGIAITPVLVIIGSLMSSEAASIPWDKPEEAIPAFVTILFMPLTYGITDGMIFGLIATIGFYITTGKIFVHIKNLSKCRNIFKPSVEEEDVSYPLRLSAFSGEGLRGDASRALSRGSVPLRLSVFSNAGLREGSTSRNLSEIEAAEDRNNESLDELASTKKFAIPEGDDEETKEEEEI